MMKAVCRVVAICASVLLVSSSAHAAPFTLSGGTAGSIERGGGLGPGGETLPDNAFIDSLFSGAPVHGYFGASIDFALPLDSTLSFQFFGAEANFENEFRFAGNVFSHSGIADSADGKVIATGLDSPLRSFTSSPFNGRLAFRFLINGILGNEVDNLIGNPARGAGPNFFAACAPLSDPPATDCSSVYLFLDDGGAGPDDDHDDLLVRVSVAAVPEPVTLTLLGVGLAGLGGRRLRRSRKTARAASTPSV